MPDEPSQRHWLGCLECGVEVRIALTAQMAVIECLECHRQFVVLRQPPGGAVDVDGVSLPPFLSRQITRD